MRIYHTAIIAAISIGLISAQTIADLPSCSISCLVTGIGTTGCATTDLPCACGKASQLSSSVLPCIASSCSAADQATAITVINAICAGAGVPVTIVAPGGSGSTLPPHPVSSSTAPPSATPASTSSAPISSTPTTSALATSAPAISSVAPSVTTKSATSSLSPTVVSAAGGVSGSPLALGAVFAMALCAVYAF